MPRFKTTKKDYQRFKEFFREAMAGYRLGNWTVKFEHKFMQNSYAETRPSLEDESVDVTLSTDWWAVPQEDDEKEEDFVQRPVTVKNLCLTALHEVRHVLLQPLVAMLERYNAEDDEVGHLEHVIIGKMEHYDSYKPKKGRK